MIIRYGGGNKGIKEYLEEGRKADRHMSRDELDYRVPIDGDLVVTQSVIDTIRDEGQDRYLHISMSFNEPNITEAEITRVYQQYREQLMTAYEDDEYNIYAEIHWPKVKESYNHKTQQMEPRFPHVHVVIPKKNVLTNRFLNPTGMHEKSVKYFDAIQEKLNRDNGLSSPRLSPRVGANHYESALDKYKEKEFKSKNGDLKRHIHAALLDRDVRTFSAFKDLVSEYGEVKVRNAGKENEYLAVKLAGDQKFTNLNANIFSSSFIKDRSLVIDPISDAQVERRVQTWREVQSREIKHISNASAKVKAHYRDLSLPERRQFLDKRESDYAKRYRASEPAVNTRRTKLPSLRERNHLPSDLKSAFRPEAETARDLYELRARNVDYFGEGRDTANRLFLQGDANNDLLDLEAKRGARLRRDLYAGERSGGGSAGGSGRAGRVVPALATDPQSSVLSSLIQAETNKKLQVNDLDRFAEIRKNLNAEHLLAFAQLKFGVDPTQHPVSKAKDGSDRIKVGKYNYNVSDFLTKHIRLEWPEASKLLEELYEKQQSGIIEKPRSKAVLLSDWMKFREEIYPQNIRTYSELKNEIKVSFSLGLKAINSEYFARKRNITQDQSLSRADKHYLRSLVILEKLQKIEALQQRIEEQNSLRNRIKYPYSTLFYDYATKHEVIDMKILDRLKARHSTPVSPDVNSIGGRRPATPHQLPNGAEAMKRARLVAKLHAQEREAKELRIKLSDLRSRPQQDGSVAFVHKDHGKQIFVNHPDRVELNRVTDPDEVGVGLMYSLERFGNPLEVTGTPEFKQQVIDVAAERDMDITFTDESLNKALEAKRLELGLEPLASNNITVQTPELDSTVPLDQAVDQALLASRVAELDAIRNGIPYSMSEVNLHQTMVEEATERHQEIEAGFIDTDRIREIAQLDLDAYTYLEGKPEQQSLALAMADMKSNGPYSDYINANGPAEFKLTVDATRFMIERDGQLSTQQPVPPVQLPDQDSPAASQIQSATDLPPSTSQTLGDTGLTANQIGQSAIRIMDLRSQELNLRENILTQEQAGASDEALASIRAELTSVQIERHELTIEATPGLKALHLSQPNPDADYLQSLDRQVEASTAALATLQPDNASHVASLPDFQGPVENLPEHIRQDDVHNGHYIDPSLAPEDRRNALLTDHQGRPWDGEQFNPNIDHEDAAMYTPYEALTVAFELEKTHADRLDDNGVQVRRYMPVEGESYKALDTQNGKALPVASKGMKEIFNVDLDRDKFLDARDNAQDRILKSDVQAGAPAPLNFTHNGQPAELDLTRFQGPVENLPEHIRQDDVHNGHYIDPNLAPEDRRNALLTDNQGRPWDGEQFNPNIDHEDAAMYTPYEALAVAFELEKTHADRLGEDGVQVRRYMPVEGESYRALDTADGKILPVATKRMKEFFDLNLDRAKYLDARDNAQARILKSDIDQANANPNQLSNADMSARIDTMVKGHAIQLDEASDQARPAILRGMKYGMENNAEYRSVVDRTLTPELRAEITLAQNLDVSTAQAQTSPAPLQFTHNGQPAELDLSRFDQSRVDNSSQAPSLSDAAALKVIELRDINERFANEGPDEVYDNIIRQGTLADSELRHADLSTKEMVGDVNGLNETARLDLDAYARLEGKPEQQNLALAMNRAMAESETYNAYVTENAPDGFAVMVEASQAVSDEQQTKAPTGLESSSTDFDM